METQLKQFVEIIDPIIGQKTLGHIQFEEFNKLIATEIDIFIKSLKKKYHFTKITKNTVTDTDGKEWNKTIILDKTGTHEEYLERVKWYLRTAPESYFEELSCIEIPEFLKYAHSCECGHLVKEKELYNGFSSLLKPRELQSISNESEVLHKHFLRELHGIEKGLRLII